MDPVVQMVIAIAALLMLGVVSELVFQKTGIPDALPLVLIGILCGPVLQVDLTPLSESTF